MHPHGNTLEQNRSSQGGVFKSHTGKTNSSHVRLKATISRTVENKMSFSRPAAFTCHFTPHREDTVHSRTKPSLELMMGSGFNHVHTCVHSLLHNCKPRPERGPESTERHRVVTISMRPGTGTEHRAVCCPLQASVLAQACP